MGTGHDLANGLVVGTRSVTLVIGMPLFALVVHGGDAPLERFNVVRQSRIDSLQSCDIAFHPVLHLGGLSVGFLQGAVLHLQLLHGSLGSVHLRF
jgi:hypothetical protein